MFNKDTFYKHQGYMAGGDFPFIGRDIGGGGYTSADLGASENIYSEAFPTTHAGYTDKEEWKGSVKDSAIDLLVHGPLWVGGAIPHPFASAFDAANAGIYHYRDKKALRNLSLLNAAIPTLMPKKIPGKNKISKLLNKYVIPKYGDDILRDVVRGKSIKEASETLSGYIGQPLLRKLAGRLAVNTREPYAYSSRVPYEMWQNLKSTKYSDPNKYGFVGDETESLMNVPKNLWTAIVRDERISPTVKNIKFREGVSPSVLPFENKIPTDAARHFLNREIWGLKQKPFVYNIEGIKHTVNFDDVFKKVKIEDLKKHQDIQYIDKGKYWKFNKDNPMGLELHHEWKRKSKRQGGKHSVLGQFGSEATEGSKASLLPPINPGGSGYSRPLGKGPEVDIHDQLFDIWDFGINPGELSARGDRAIGLRQLGTKLDFWDPVKVTQSINDSNLSTKSFKEAYDKGFLMRKDMFPDLNPNTQGRLLYHHNKDLKTYDNLMNLNRELLKQKELSNLEYSLKKLNKK